MNDFIFWPILVPVTAIVGWFVYSIVRAVTLGKVRELEVRERIAMIERGLVPPPEKDPQAFDRAMSRYDRFRELHDEEGRGGAAGRFRSGGVTIIGVGLGLMLLIGVAGGNTEAAVGVGGFLVVLGLAFVINSLLTRNRLQANHYRSPQPSGSSWPPQSQPGGAPQPSQQLPQAGSQPPSFGGNEPPRST